MDCTLIVVLIQFIKLMYESTYVFPIQVCTSIHIEFNFSSEECYTQNKLLCQINNLNCFMSILINIYYINRSNYNIQNKLKFLI